METHFTQNNDYIEVNDVFEEFNEENKRLVNELNFANISLNVLIKCKKLSKRIYEKYYKNIDSEDKQKLKQLDEEFNSINLSVDEFMKQNVCIKTEEQNIFEIKEKDINRETNEESIIVSTVMSTEDMDIISEMDVKSETIFEIKDMTNSDSTDVSPHIDNNTEIRNEKKINDHSFLNNKTTKITKVLDCQLCDETFDTKLELNGHKSVHLDIKQNDVNFKTKIKNISGIKQKNKRKIVSNQDLNQLNDELFDKNIDHLDSDTDISDSNDYQNNYSVEETSDKSIDNNKQFKCFWPKCQYITKTKSNLKVHKRTHFSENKFKCDINGCHKKYKSYNGLYNHKKYIHSKIRYSCDWKDCNKIFNYKYNLKQHKEIVHKNKPKHLCDVEGCGKVLMTKRNLILHKCIHSGEKTFKCDINGCDRKLFRVKSNLTQHQLSHSIVKMSWKCKEPGCKKFFERKDSLKVHQDQIHLHKTFKCVECNKIYTSKGSYYYHKRCVHKPNVDLRIQYSCDWKDCNKTFKNKQNLNVHKSIHSGEKPFKCDINGCDKYFRVKSHLNQHKLSHNKEREKPFK